MLLGGIPPAAHASFNTTAWKRPSADSAGVDFSEQNQKNTTDCLTLVKLAPAPIQIWVTPIFNNVFMMGHSKSLHSREGKKHTHTTAQLL